MVFYPVNEMIKSILIATSILISFHEPDKFEPIDNSIKVDIHYYDWAFMDIQEKWVVENSSRNINNLIPKYIYKLILQLDANCYKCREIACKKLKKLKNNDYIYLLWVYDKSSLESKKHLYHIIGYHARCWVVHETQTCGVCFGINQFWPISALEAVKNRKDVLTRGDFERLPNGDWNAN